MKLLLRDLHHSLQMKHLENYIYTSFNYLLSLETVSDIESTFYEGGRGLNSHCCHAKGIGVRNS